MRFIADHVCYPAVDAENGITGKVVVSFVIDKNGKVTDVNIIFWHISNRRFLVIALRAMNFGYVNCSIDINALQAIAYCGGSFSID